MVWTPVTLILDAGVMLQIYALIIEAISFQDFVQILTGVITKPFDVVGARRHKSLQSDPQDLHEDAPGQRRGSSFPVDIANVPGSTPSTCDTTSI